MSAVPHRSAALTDAQRERAIDRAYQLMLSAKNPRRQAAAWRLLTRLIGGRTPGAVANLEGARGLVERRRRPRP